MQSSCYSDKSRNVVSRADWIIDLGPDGGDKGGEIVVVGTRETALEHPNSYAGRYLKQGQGVTWFFYEIYIVQNCSYGFWVAKNHEGLPGVTRY